MQPQPQPQPRVAVRRVQCAVCSAGTLLSLYKASGYLHMAVATDGDSLWLLQVGDNISLKLASCCRTCTYILLELNYHALYVT
jgi:hypothetical protein